MAAFCDNGVLVVGVNAQHSFSFLRERATVHELTVADSGSQFRSRDPFPGVVAELATGGSSAVGPPLDEALVPPLPEQAVAYVDGYGNLKTTWASAPGQMGDLVQITTGGASAVAVVTDGTFAVRQGEMSFAPGSSGWARPGGRRALYEVLLRGGSASERLGSPRAGAPVDVRPL